MSALVCVRQCGTLVVAVPRAWLGCVCRVPLNGLPEKGQQLLSFVEVGLAELQRLSLAAPTEAVRSLGYALHPIPHLVRNSEEFDAQSYRFCFRIVAFFWSELSPEVQQAFCDRVGMDRYRGEILMQTPGFGINMYRNGGSR